MDSSLLTERVARCRRLLAEGGPTIVALSGGVDSAVLLALAVEALGPDRVLAVTAESESMPAGEVADAEGVARAVGAAHRVVRTEELRNPAYRSNRGDRCFHCRTELFDALGRIARETAFRSVVYGAIADDRPADRPGMAAADRAGVRAPLREAGLRKADVRALARARDLPVRDKPAAACLASRIPVGEEVTAERLRQVGRAEAALRALGFGLVRVRHHGEVARIETDPEGVRRLEDPTLREAVVQAVRDAGFRFAAVDLEGYREGSVSRPRDPGPTTGAAPRDP